MCIFANPPTATATVDHGGDHLIYDDGGGGQDKTDPHFHLEKS